MPVDRESFQNAEGQTILYAMIRTIQENSKSLSEIDGAIGDGDHGINMNKGFTMCRERLEEKPPDSQKDWQPWGRCF